MKLMSLKRAATCIVGICSILGGASAVAIPVALSPTTPLQINATLASQCSISVSPLSFTFSSTTNPIQNINGNVTCTGTTGTQNNLAITAASLSSPTGNNTGTGRVLANGTNTIGYQLYTDSTALNIWTNNPSTIGTASTVIIQPNTANVTGGVGYTGYLKITEANLATKPAGTYTDTVTLQLYLVQ